MKNETDEQLLDLIKMGDRAAFVVMVRRHTKYFYRIAYRTLQNTHDAEDIVQDSFIKLWESPCQWDGQKRSTFTAWFYRIILNRCNDMLRSGNRTITCQVEEINRLVEGGGVAADHSDALGSDQECSVRYKNLSYAVMLLPDSQRDAVNLVYYMGLAQKEVSEILSISVKALESLLMRAKKNMKKTCLKIELDGGSIR